MDVEETIQRAFRQTPSDESPEMQLAEIAGYLHNLSGLDPDASLLDLLREDHEDPYSDVSDGSWRKQRHQVHPNDRDGEGGS